jgi:GNAT superfamily N-acetyltransferase
MRGSVSACGRHLRYAELADLGVFRAEAGLICLLRVSARLCPETDTTDGGQQWEHPSVPSYRIRPATADDVRFLADVVIEATRAQGRLPEGFDERHWRTGFSEWTMEQVRDGHSGRMTSVVEVDNERAGRLRVTRTAGCIELCGIQLRPGFQRHGIGTAIIEDLKTQAAAAGIPLGLGVEKDNPDALRLYERLGFVRVGETDQEYKLRWDPRPGASLTAELP